VQKVTKKALSLFAALVYAVVVVIGGGGDSGGGCIGSEGQEGTRQASKNIHVTVTWSE